jgi:Condensation domain
MTGARSLLSRAQERMLLAEMLLPGAVDNVVMLAFRLRGPLRLGQLEAAVCDVVNRHEALRTVLVWDDRGPGQQVLPPSRAISPHLEVLDWSRHGGTAETTATAACSDWWDEPFDLTKSPPFRFRLIRLEPGQHLFCLAFHHIAADGWSGRLLGAEVGQAYSARLAGSGPLGPPDQAPQPTAYTAWERAHLPAWLARDLPFWRSVMADPGSPLLAKDDVICEGTCITYCRAASPHVARLYLDLSRRSRLRRFTGQAALAVAESLRAARSGVAGAGQVSRIRLGTLTSGRSERRFRRTVASFINPMVLPVNIDDPAEPVTDTFLQECLDHSQAPFDEVLRVLPPTVRSNPYAILVTLDDWSAFPVSASPMEHKALKPSRPRTSASLRLTLTIENGGSVEVTGSWRADIIDSDIGRRLVDRLCTIPSQS